MSFFDVGFFFDAIAKCAKSDYVTAGVCVWDEKWVDVGNP